MYRQPPTPHRTHGYNFGIFGQSTDPETTDENVEWMRDSDCAIAPFRASGAAAATRSTAAQGPERTRCPGTSTCSVRHALGLGRELLGTPLVPAVEVGEMRATPSTTPTPSPPCWPALSYRTQSWSMSMAIAAGLYW
jgi:hypothetical protein